MEWAIFPVELLLRITLSLLCCLNFYLSMLLYRWYCDISCVYSKSEESEEKKTFCKQDGKGNVVRRVSASQPVSQTVYAFVHNIQKLLGTMYVGIGGFWRDVVAGWTSAELGRFADAEANDLIRRWVRRDMLRRRRRYRWLWLRSAYEIYRTCECVKTIWHQGRSMNLPPPTLIPHASAYFWLKFVWSSSGALAR